jgi:aspartyl-tRNA synthetase
MEADHEAPQTERKIRTFATDEWKSRQVFELGVNPSNECIGSIRAPFFDIVINAKQIGFGSIRDYDSRP